MRRGGPALDVIVIGMIPNIPLVKRKVNGVFFMFFAFDGVANGNHGFDKLVHRHVLREEACGVVGFVVIILVERDIIHLVISEVERGKLPVAERVGVPVGTAAEDKLNRGVDPAHDLGGFRRGTAVFIGGFVADLPVAVHFVA